MTADDVFNNGPFDYVCCRPGKVGPLSFAGQEFDRASVTCLTRRFLDDGQGVVTIWRNYAVGPSEWLPSAEATTARFAEVAELLGECPAVVHKGSCRT